MSRQHSNLLREVSNDERAKNRTKKGKHHQQKRSDHHQLKTYQNSECKFTQLLLHVANSMSQFVERNCNIHFKSNDVKVMELIITELTLIKRMQEYEKEQNKVKVKEMKSHIQRVRQKRQEVIYQSQRINMLIRSGSPKQRKPLIACEMSPQMINHNGMIERKIEEDNNREKTTFESLKKKQQCFKRLFEFVDKIFDKLHLEKAGFSFKTNMARIESAIQAITLRETEIMNKMKDDEKYLQEIGQLKRQNEKLRQSNEGLNQQIKSANIIIQGNKLILKQMNIKYSELEQDFSLIVKQKLDAQTAYSKISQQLQRERDRYEKVLSSLRLKCSQILRQQIEELKSVHIGVRRQVGEEYRSLECQHVATINSIIYRYTQQLKKMSHKQHKLKRQVLFLQSQHQNNIVQLSREIAQKQNQLQEINNRKSKLSIVSQVVPFIDYSNKSSNKFNIHVAFSLYYIPKSDTKPTQQYQLSIYSKVIKHCFEPKQKRLSLHLKSLSLGFSWRKEKQDQYNQTYQQNKIISQQNQFIQTNAIQLLNKDTQIQAQKQQSSVQYEGQYSLSYWLAFSLNLASPIVKSDIGTQALGHNLISSSTNTQTVLMRQQSTCICMNEQVTSNNPQTKEEGVNTQFQSLYSQQEEEQNMQYIDERMQVSSCKKKQDTKEEDLVLQLLLQAEQCIMVPEIYVLRQQINNYKAQVLELKKKCVLLERQRESEDQNVFQFCY